MALILCIETATDVCSVALSRDEKLMGIKESSIRNIHSAILTTFIDELINSPGMVPADLDAIAVSMGPGSYTGLRIGVATAKGLCYALDKPLIAVPTLQSMAAGMAANGGTTLFCPMIDARRMEVYCAVFDHENMELREVRAEIIDEYSFQEFLSDHIMVLGGDGADKCKPVLANQPNAIFLNGFQATASTMMGIAAEKFREHRFENLAYFEPFYLKDFVAGKPRVKGLF